MWRPGSLLALRVPSSGCWVMKTTGWSSKWTEGLWETVVVLPLIPSVALAVMPLHRDKGGVHCLGAPSRQHWGRSHCVCMCVCAWVTACDMRCVHSVHGSQVGLTLTCDAFWSWSEEDSDPTNVYWAPTKFQAFYFILWHILYHLIFNNNPLR